MNRFLLGLLLTTSAFALPDNFVLKNLTSENRLVVNKAIDRGFDKVVYFQHGLILDRKDIDTRELFCSLDNGRDKKKRMILPKGTTFIFDNNDYVRENAYVGIRIWKKHWLFGRDNGVVQGFTCNNNGTFHETGVFVPITHKMFKQVVGPYLKLQ